MASKKLSYPAYIALKGNKHVLNFLSENLEKDKKTSKQIKEILEDFDCYNLDLDLELQSFLSKHDDVMRERYFKLTQQEIYFRYKKKLDKIYSEMKMDREQRRMFHWLLSEFAIDCGEKERY